MATNGLVVMTPTSVAKTGASSTATINADGSVTFGSCETLSLNGVFTSDYDNYMVTIRLGMSASASFLARLRASGSDNATASSYVRQSLIAGTTTVSANRITDDKFTNFGIDYATQKSGCTAYLFGPYLSQPTAVRTVVVSDNSSAYIVDQAQTHNQSSSYDGITFYTPTTQEATGLVTVFGFNQ